MPRSLSGQSEVSFGEDLAHLTVGFPVDQNWNLITSDSST